MNMFALSQSKYISNVDSNNDLAPIIQNSKTIEPFEDDGYQMLYSDLYEENAPSAETEIVIQSDEGEPSKFGSYYNAYVTDTNMHAYDDSEVSNHNPTHVMASNTQPIEKWSPLTHVYVGSLTIVGLFVLFRALQNSK